MAKHNLKIVGSDTDAVFLSKIDESPISREEFDQYLVEMNEILPDMILIEDDGMYDSFLTLKAKNYVTRCDGKVKIRGGALKDSKKEKALLDMLDELIHSLLNGINYDELNSIYIKYIKMIGSITEIGPWCSKKTLTKSILNCETDPNARANERKVWDAIKGKELQEGDKFFVYAAQDGMKQKKTKGELVFLADGTPKLEPNFILKMEEDYDNDHIPSKLVKRVYATLKIFENVIDMKQFLNYSLKSQAKLLAELLET